MYLDSSDFQYFLYLVPYNKNMKYPISSVHVKQKIPMKLSKFIYIIKY